MDHAWCHDAARDAAVRAAEDGRTGPLPTLGECIEAVTKTMSENGKGEEMQHGLRTERVTLECVHRFGKPPREWDWWRLMELRPGESVRVVDETHFDGLAQVAMERDAAIREREDLREQLESVACRAATAETALEAAQAASGGNSSAQPNGSQDESGGGEGEPVAWGVMVGGKIDQHAGSDALFVDNEEAQEWCHDAAISNRGTVVPLYRQPPQPSGWLTEEEREAVDAARDYFDDDDHGDSECVFIARVLKQLLARSSPPEVMLPAEPDCSPIADYGRAWRDCLDAVRSALAAAGVAVKLPPGAEGE